MDEDLSRPTPRAHTEKLEERRQAHRGAGRLPLNPELPSGPLPLCLCSIVDADRSRPVGAPRALQGAREPMLLDREKTAAGVGEAQGWVAHPCLLLFRAQCPRWEEEAGGGRIHTPWKEKHPPPQTAFSAWCCLFLSSYFWLEFGGRGEMSCHGGSVMCSQACSEHYGWVGTTSLASWNPRLQCIICLRGSRASHGSKAGVEKEANAGWVSLGRDGGPVGTAPCLLAGRVLTGGCNAEFGSGLCNLFIYLGYVFTACPFRSAQCPGWLSTFTTVRS